MSLVEYINSIRKSVGIRTTPGFTLENIKKSSSISDLLFNWEEIESRNGEDLAEIEKLLKIRCKTGQVPLITGTNNEVVKSVICSVDPRWLPVLLYGVKRLILDFNGVLPILTSKIVKGTNPLVIAKIVPNYHEVFVGYKINQIMDKAPAFVHTFGHKGCSKTSSESASMVCFPASEKYIEGPVQLLTEYIQDTITMGEWLQKDRETEDLKFVFLQVLANLLRANEEVGFVHGDLHTRNILLKINSFSGRVAIPYKNRVRYYEGKIEARIIDYGLSTVVEGNETFVGYTSMPTNHQDVWNDIIKMLLCSSMFSSKENSKRVSLIASDTFGIEESLISVGQFLKPTMVVPPNQKIFRGLPNLEKVCDRLFSEFALHEEQSTFTEITDASDVSKMALGLLPKADRELKLKFFVESYLGVLEIFLDRDIKIVDSGKTLPEENLEALASLFSLLEFLAKQLRDAGEFRERAWKQRKRYERMFITLTAPSDK